MRSFHAWCDLTGSEAWSSVYGFNRLRAYRSLCLPGLGEAKVFVHLLSFKCLTLDDLFMQCQNPLLLSRPVFF